MNKFNELKATYKTLIRQSHGFSLIEILVALTLLGLIGSFVVGKIFDQLHEGQVKAAKIQMNSLATQLREFRRKCNFYPTTDQGLEALVSKPGGRDCKNYPTSGFLDGDSVPVDPWDNEFFYESDGRTFNIMSFGPDGEQGGEDKDADIPMREKK